MVLDKQDHRESSTFVWVHEKEEGGAGTPGLGPNAFGIRGEEGVH